MLSRQEEQEERRQVVQNERRIRDQGSPSSFGTSASTFLSHTHNDIGGRFAAISSAVVVGTEAIPKYPAAFLQHDPVPDENPLGVDVNALEPCGEPHEVRASIHDLNPSAQHLPAGYSGDLTTPAPPSGQVRSPTFRRF